MLECNSVSNVSHNRCYIIVGAVTPVSSVEQSAASTPVATPAATPASLGRSEWVSLADQHGGAEESCQDTLGKYPCSSSRATYQ